MIAWVVESLLQGIDRRSCANSAFGVTPGYYRYTFLCTADNSPTILVTPATKPNGPQTRTVEPAKEIEGDTTKKEGVERVARQKESDDDNDSAEKSLDVVGSLATFA